MKDFANLDFLRASAVLSVFFAHLHDILFGRSELTWHFGQLGVLAFFVHTSLVLMYSLERQLATGQPLFSGFYIRRWFRLYPLSIFCVCVAYIFHLYPNKEIPFHTWSIPEFATNLSLTQNLFYKDSMVGGLWTLPLEVQMYVILPVLFVFLLRKRWHWVPVLWVGAIVLALIQKKVTGRLDVLQWAPCFLGGILAWKLGRRRWTLPGAVWPIGLAIVSLIWFCATRKYDTYFRWAFCFALGAAIPFFGTMPANFLSRAAAIVAKYSYGIYLFHISAMVTAFGLLGHFSRVVQWIAFVAIAVSAPFLAFHLLESPLIEVGKRLAERIHSAPQTARLLECGTAAGMAESPTLTAGEK
jgi:peptidoglycan/LPS O-acetylase OafA/YrhL